MKKKTLISKVLLVSWIVLSVICGFQMRSEALEQDVSINALIQETQKMSQESDKMTMVWWIPDEYWLVSAAQDPTLSESDADQFINLLGPYFLVMAVDGKIGPFGGVTYTDMAEIKKNIRLVDADGHSYGVLSDDKINADTTNFLSMIKPVFSNMLGPMGQNMHFFLFPSKDANGKRIGDAMKEGSFTIQLAGDSFHWRLPLSSLIPPKKCPKCGEELSGAYKFCPWDGTRLP